MYFFVNMLIYFILASALGYYLILNVEPALFSPLRSTGNSLSGVVILGEMLMASLPQGSVSNFLGCMATTVTAINVFGGCAVSYRMLLMYSREVVSLLCTTKNINSNLWFTELKVIIKLVDKNK